MENHPIPQDVTGFQFKLIGNMTIKQFAYLAVGVVLAVILYYTPFSGGVGALIKMLFIPLFGAGGVILAFVPIEGRPIDVMIGNFIKALVSPNQYVYQKTDKSLNFAPKPNPQTTSGSQLQQPPPATKDIDKKEQSIVQSVMTAQQTVKTPTQSPPTVQQTTPVKQAPSIDAKQQQQALTQQITQAHTALSPQEILKASSLAKQKAASLERQVQELHFQRQQLEEQLQHLQKQIAVQQTPQKNDAQQPPMQQTQAQQQPPQQTQQAVPVPNSAPAQTTQQVQSKQPSGLPHVPDTANVIAGIVKDPRGNVLPNMLVEVKDSSGNPVRAFKTNALGQFASATPLSAGEYTVELEDPKKQNTFDVIQLHANNQILLPIEIISHDAREELRKQLFN